MKVCAGTVPCLLRELGKLGSNLHSHWWRASLPSPEIAVRLLLAIASMFTLWCTNSVFEWMTRKRTNLESGGFLYQWLLSLWSQRSL